MIFFFGPSSPLTPVHVFSLLDSKKINECLEWGKFSGVFPKDLLQKTFFPTKEFCLFCSKDTHIWDVVSCRVFSLGLKFVWILYTLS